MERITLIRLLSLLISHPLILILIVKSKNNKQAVGDVSTDSDWWGNSATPCSLAAGHGLISLDESHWHLSYLNDYVYLSISPPPSSRLSPSPWPCSRILPQFRDHGGVHAHTLAGRHRSGRVRRSSGREWVFTAGGPLASRSEARFRSKWKYFFLLTTDAGQRWVTHKGCVTLPEKQTSYK